jgi:hypothetical protein
VCLSASATGKKNKRKKQDFFCYYVGSKPPLFHTNRMELTLSRRRLSSQQVLLLLCTGDRGLCGGFNNFVIKKAVARVAELEGMGIKAKLVCIGKKGAVYFKRRPEYEIVKIFNMVGLYKLNPVDPQLERSLGSTLEPIKVKTWFQSFCFQTQLAPLQQGTGAQDGGRAGDRRRGVR